MLAAAIALFALDVIALPPEKQERVVSEARAILDVPYRLGGRLRDRDGDGRGDVDDGIDCQGLIFYALQAISECGWRSWSVMPTESVKGELGVPIGEAISVDALAAALPTLAHGDVIWFLDSIENPAEPSITKLDDVPMWVWHTALYVGEGKAIIGDHFAGRVVEEELVPYTKLHYAGVLVTRMKDGPVPRATSASKCKKHAPMKYVKSPSPPSATTR